MTIDNKFIVGMMTGLVLCLAVMGTVHISDGVLFFLITYPLVFLIVATGIWLSNKEDL